MSDSIQMMNNLLGNNYHILATGETDPIVLAKLPDEDLAQKNSVTEKIPFSTPSGSQYGNTPNPSSQPVENVPANLSEKTTDDYLFQFYLGSMTIVGLFILFRMIQKSK